MSGFIINRYGESSANSTAADEAARLKKLQEKIEKNKDKRVKQRKKQKKKEWSKIAVTRKSKRKPEKSATPDEEENLLEPEKWKQKQVGSTNGIDKPETPPVVKKTQEDDIEGFTILGDKHFGKKSKVKRVLPKWLTTPTVISVNLQQLDTKVSHMKELDKSLRKKLKDTGIKYLFPVQAEVIPWLLKSHKNSDIIIPRDVCVSAPTGSGKTLAFVLPVIQALMHYTVKKIRALVILPTQDLAVQVFKAFKFYAKGTTLDVTLITGKSSFSMEQKQLVYENAAFGYLSKVDILVCTAGRLVDHIKNTKGFCFKNLEYLVIDEADRVLDTVQHDWLYHLEKHISQDDISSTQGPKVLNLFTLQKQRPPQKLLFSATLSQDPEKLQKLSLFQPKLFTSVVGTDGNAETTVENEVQGETFIGKYTTPRELTEKYIACSLELKPLVLYEFIKKEKLTKTIVFAHSVDTVHRLSILLKGLFKGELKVEEISSNLETKCRNMLMDQFSKGEIDILVCTDALARGVDLPGVQCVVSYSAPKFIKTYIHRAGRTARAGENGLAVTLLHKSQQNKFLNLLKQAGKQNIVEVEIPEESLEPLGEQYQEVLQALKTTMEKEVKDEMIKSKSGKMVLKNKGKKRKRSINA